MISPTMWFKQKAASLGDFEQEQGNYTVAQGYYKEGLATSRELGDRWSAANQ